ncbi:MFS transporter [Kitasatospora albolonga]
MNGSFVRLVVSHLCSHLGFRVAHTVFPLTALTVVGASAADAALLMGLQTAGFLLVGLPAGAWVDRWHKTLVMVTADAVRAAVFLGLALVWALGTLRMEHLYAAALVAGVTSVFFDVSAQTVLPSLVAKEKVVSGNAWMMGVESAATVAGPVIAGALAIVAAPVGFWLAGGAFVVSAGCLLGVRVRMPRSPGRGVYADVAEGVRFIAGRRVLLRIGVATGLFNLAWSATVSLLLAIMLSRGAGEAAAGVVIACFGAGGVFGATVVKRFAVRLGRSRAITTALAVPAPFTVLAGLTGRVPLWVTGVALFGVGASAVMYNVTQLSLRQEITPPALLGRVNATMRFLVWGMIPLGAALASAGARTVGPMTVTVLAGTACAFVWLVLVRLGADDGPGGGPDEGPDGGPDGAGTRSRPGGVSTRTPPA